MTIESCSLVPSASPPRPAQWTGEKISVYEAMAILAASRDTVQRMIDSGLLIAWQPNPRGRKQVLWRSQVEAVAREQQARAAKRAEVLQMQMRLPFF